MRSIAELQAIFGADDEAKLALARTAGHTVSWWHDNEGITPVDADGYMDPDMDIGIPALIGGDEPPQFPSGRVIDVEPVAVVDHPAPRAELPAPG